MKTFEIYRNYGCLAAEKRSVYTYGQPQPTATCSDKLEVQLPENDFFEVYETTLGSLAVETADGKQYGVDEVLAGDKRPEFRAYDEQKMRIVKLAVISE